MKKKQYTTKQKMALAAKIMKRAVEISESTPHDVFCYYFPHVDRIDILIYTDGWRDCKDYDKKPLICFNGCHDPEAEIAEVMAALDELQQGAE